MFLHECMVYHLKHDMYIHLMYACHVCYSSMSHSQHTGLTVDCIALGAVGVVTAASSRPLTGVLWMPAWAQKAAGAT